MKSYPLNNKGNSLWQKTVLMEEPEIEAKLRSVNEVKNGLNQEKSSGCDFFCVFFWLFGEKSVPLQ